MIWNGSFIHKITDNLNALENVHIKYNTVAL